MNSSTKRWPHSTAIYLALCLACCPSIHAQKILSYGPDDLTASIHYNEFLYGVYKNYYKKLPDYPIKGVYSPTHYSDGSNGMRIGAGACNYIYIPTNEQLQPGQQYRISLTVKVGKAYAQMPYFKLHLGVTLTSDLYKNYMGLWTKHFVPLGIETTEEVVTVDFVFRPLCTSKYLVLGVFQGTGMDNLDGFAEQYGFELHNLLVEQYDDPQADFVYMCDAFEEERIKKLFSSGYDTDTIFFESGSAEIHEKYFSILDSVPSKLRTIQDLVRLYGYTDKAGSENDTLGAARNASVSEALIARGIDTSRISMVNYGESKASGQISQEDRRVEIDMNRAKLFQKYYTEAKQAATKGEYNVAQAKITHWLKMVPPENAIYALFDCWGEGDKSTIFKRDLAKNIRSRYYYKDDALKFTFDSLYCEDQKGRTLSMYLTSNYLPDTYANCTYNIDSLYEENLLGTIEHIYKAYGFPSVEEVGVRGNKVLPYMLIHAADTSFQNRYLPIIQKACEDQYISWEFYAMLYDKINVIRNGHQRYGTQYDISKKGVPPTLLPIEDKAMVDEYRKRVGLVPLSDF